MTAKPNRIVTVALGLMAVAALTLPVWASQSPLDDSTRPDADRERDAGSKPLEVYAFFGIDPGMTVVDLMPGGGYNTHVLSLVVGDDGKVYSGPDRRGRIQPRVDEAGLSNVEVFTDYSVLAANSIDVMVTVRNVHDLENRGGGGEVYATYLAALKPGGILGVVDARTDKPGVDESTHRINEQLVVDVITAAGFELVERSEMLANADDNVDESGRGSRWMIDRFVLKFQKPE